MKKSIKKLLIILGGIICILLILFIYVVLSLKRAFKNYDLPIPEEELEIRDYNRMVLDFSDCNFRNSNVCVRRFSSNEVKIEKLSDIYYEIFINDFSVIKNVRIYPKEFNILDDNIIFEVNSTDVRTTSIFAFDKYGDNTLSLYYIDEKYPTMLITTLPDDAYKYYKIVDNEIILYGSRYNHGPSLVVSSENSRGDYLCENNNIEKYKDEVVRGEYKVKYLGNNTFSEVENIKYVKLSEESSELCK